MSDGSAGEVPETTFHDEPSTPLIVDSEIVYDGAVWNIRREVFDYDDRELTREFVDHTGAVAILAMDGAGQVLLIQQYRHPIRMRDWELPAGLLDIAGEPPLVAAKRELEEEVDLVAETWTELVDFFSSPGGSNELIRVFLAQGVSASATPFDRVEEEANIRKRWVPLQEVVDGVLAGRLRNSILAIAVLAAHARG
jgi:8-oxo-dGTP pyrophosphatase MutT (NUDIX family)